MTEAQISEWMFADAEQLREGEALLLLEADISANEVEAPASCTLRIVAEEGVTHPVGTVLGYIE